MCELAFGAADLNFPAGVEEVCPMLLASVTISLAQYGLLTSTWKNLIGMMQNETRSQLHQPK
jgi:hypothetical protein